MGIFFARFRYKVIYRKGEFNNADALSRLTKDIEEQKQASKQVTQIDISKFQTSKGLNLVTVNSIQNQTHKNSKDKFRN